VGIVSRIVIVGGPRTGKTTLAFALATERQIRVIRHTDSLIDTHDWGSASTTAAHWFDATGRWIVEGVAAVRALRKWLDRHCGDRLVPCDEVITLWHPRVSLSPGQETMAKGVRTVWDEVLPRLVSRGLRHTNRG
jgi:broad-specificity NMP kinase